MTQDAETEHAHVDRAIQRIRVWDLPTRLFHWALVILVFTSFVTAAIGGNAMQVHERCGFTILALLLFRFAWGVVGGQPSRFSSFLHGPAAAAKYAADLFHGESSPWLGHNPIGGWSVMAMLLTLFVQAGTGLFASDDIMTQGPLFVLVSSRTSNWLTRVHTLNAGIIGFLVAIHGCAILFYLLVKRENLIAPMITGFKRWAGSPAESVAERPLTAAALAVLAVAAVGLLIRLGQP